LNFRKKEKAIIIAVAAFGLTIITVATFELTTIEEPRNTEPLHDEPTFETSTAPTPPESEGGSSLLLTLKGHTKYLREVAVTPDGKKVISGGEDITLKVWDIESGKELRTLEGHTDSVFGVAVGERNYLPIRMELVQ